jgi:hypothetical protein
MVQVVLMVATLRLVLIFLVLVAVAELGVQTQKTPELGVAAVGLQALPRVLQQGIPMGIR